MSRPSTEELALLEEWQALRDQNMNCTQIGRLYNKTGDLIRSALYRYNLHWRKKPVGFGGTPLGEPLELEGDWMLCGDVHVPTTNYQLSQLMLAVAKKQLTHPRLIIAGDFFSMDSFSKYQPTVTPPSWDQECKAGAKLLKDWFEVFTEIVVIQGNHDRRMTKGTMGAINAEHIFKMVTDDLRLRVSNFGWLTINTEFGKYRITHSTNYSINQLTVASELANKFQNHIISFHEHRLAMGMDRYGRYLVVNGGGLFDDTEMAYVHLDDSKMPAMVPGFVMLRDGIPSLFGKAPFTNWANWL